MRHPSASAAATAIALALGVLACGGGGGHPADPVEPRISCPPPLLVDGGLNPAVEPTACLGPPRPSGLPAAPADAVHGWQDLGAHRVSRDQLVDVTVPAGTASLLLVEQLVSGGPPGQLTTVTFPGGGTQVQPNMAVIGELWDPSGRLVYTDLEIISGSDFSAALVTALGVGPVVGSVAYPSTSAGLQATAVGGVAPGTWRVMVNDYGYECWLASQPDPPPGLAGLSCDAPSRTDDAVYQLYALTTPAAGATAIPARGTIDVAFHIVDDPNPQIGVTAAAAPTDPSVQRMVESFGWLMSGAGICLGTVTFLDAPDWARTRYATTTSADDPVPCGNLSQLLATSRPAQPALELFLVPFLQAGPNDVARVIGVDGTIPGPATVNGTIASGAVASAEDLKAGRCPAPGAPPALFTCGADLVAYVAAHEAGHFLGLYHPTEFAGDLFDPLTDTARCECSARCGLSPATCAAGIPSARCLRDSRCGGGANLMFWQLGAASVGLVSPEQARIVRSSPLVRAP
jgi:hypothetical protein